MSPLPAGVHRTSDGGLQIEPSDNLRFLPGCLAAVGVVIGLGLIGAGLFLRRVTDDADGTFLVVGVVMVLGSAVLPFVIARQQRGQWWRIDRDGVSVNAARGSASVAWSDVASLVLWDRKARLRARPGRPGPYVRQVDLLVVGSDGSERLRALTENDDTRIFAAVEVARADGLIPPHVHLERRHGWS